MAAGVPRHPHQPSPTEGEEQRGGEKQAGQKHQNTEPSQKYTVIDSKMQYCYNFNSNNKHFSTEVDCSVNNTTCQQKCISSSLHKFQQTCKQGILSLCTFQIIYVFVKISNI